ncbi:hypothetical protein O3G_MSEX003925, partial [Manduca sexta]
WSPTLRLPVRGLYSRTFLHHLPSVLRAMCSDRCHFSLLTRWAVSVTFVLLWMHDKLNKHSV